MKPTERADYTPMPDRPRLRLPGEARLVVWPIVNVETWDIEGPMPRAVLPPPGGDHRLVPDLANWAWHEYGMRVGFWRLKSALDDVGVRATLSINASVCEHYPELAAAARDAEWEFMGHAYVQKPMHKLDDEGAHIRRTVDTLRRFTGRPVRGWLGPGLTETFDTVDLLAEQGIEYVADWVFDEHPVPLRTRHGTIHSMPYTVELNDIPMMMIQHHPARELYDRAMAQFERLYAESAADARIMAVAVHPYITGVPHRIGHFERLLAALKDKPGVVFWTGDRILDWYLEASAGSRR